MHGPQDSARVHRIVSVGYPPITMRLFQFGRRIGEATSGHRRQYEFVLVQHDAVPAGALGLVERAVGASDQALRGSGATSDSERMDGCSAAAVQASVEANQTKSRGPFSYESSSASGVCANAHRASTVATPATSHSSHRRFHNGEGFTQRGSATGRAT
jgi:hypothetical protein